MNWLKGLKENDPVIIQNGIGYRFLSQVVQVTESEIIAQVVEGSARKRYCKKTGKQINPRKGDDYLILEATPEAAGELRESELRFELRQKLNKLLAGSFDKLNSSQLQILIERIQCFEDQQLPRAGDKMDWLKELKKNDTVIMQCGVGSRCLSRVLRVTESEIIAQATESSPIRRYCKKTGKQVNPPPTGDDYLISEATPEVVEELSRRLLLLKQHLQKLFTDRAKAYYDQFD